MNFFTKKYDSLKIQLNETSNQIKNELGKSCRNHISLVMLTVFPLYYRTFSWKGWNFTREGIDNSVYVPLREQSASYASIK